MAITGPRCAACGKPRRIVAARRWVDLPPAQGGCACPATWPDGPPKIPADQKSASQPDGVHYHTLPRPTLANRMKQPPPRDNRNGTTDR